MNIITQMQSFHNQLRVYHWQTQSYAEHKALGELYTKFSDLVDRFIETYMGKYGIITKDDGFIFVAKNYTDVKIATVLDGMVKYLVTDLPSMLEPVDTDLLNIRDEMLGEINKTKYLITLR